MNEIKQRKKAYNALKSIEGSEIILKECHPRIMDWVFKHLTEIIKLLPIENWESDWSYYTLTYIKVPEKYWDMLYNSVSKESGCSYCVFEYTKVPEKYKKLLKKSARKGGYNA